MIKDLNFNLPAGKAGLKTAAGFTLIETIIYLALFAMFMGGAIAAAYNIFEASDRNQAKAMAQEEGNFLVAKIEWALSGAQIINSPPAPLADSTLWVTRVDGFDGAGAPILTPVVISLSGTDMRLVINPAINTPITLNNSAVTITNLSFSHTYPSGDGINPESLSASFTVSTKTAGGLAISQDFFTAKYLRK